MTRTKAEDRHAQGVVLKVVGAVLAGVVIGYLDWWAKPPVLACILGTAVALFAAYLVAKGELPLDEFGMKLAAGAAGICALLARSPLGPTDSAWPAPGQWFWLAAAYGTLATWLGFSVRVFEVWRNEEDRERRTARR